MKVLVVEDSVSMRQMVRLILTSEGHIVVEAVDGSDGLNKVHADVDLIITDYNMPNVGGVEFIRGVRNGTLNPRVPILMLTTESTAQKKNEGREAGATAWITKPFNRDLLLATISRITRTVEF